MRQRGFSLIELMITVTVLTILTMGVLPLVKVSVKRQKEQQYNKSPAGISRCEMLSELLPSLHSIVLL